MATFDVFHAGAIELEGTILRAPSDVNENLNHTIVRRHHAGRIAPIYSVMGSIMPGVTFNTPEIKTALSVITKDGIEIADTTIHYTRRHKVANSDIGDHPATKIASGIAVPRTLSWNGGVAPWLLAVELRPDSDDGLTDPFVYTQMALPALALIPETYCGGMLLINGEEMDCLQSITLDWGMVVDQVLHKGLPAPVRSGVQEVKPTLRFTNLDVEYRRVFGEFGTRVESAELYLRKNAGAIGVPPGAAPPHRVPDTIAEHIKLTFVAGILAPGSTVCPEEAKATQEIEIVFDETDADDWMVPTYDVVIPAPV